MSKVAIEGNALGSGTFTIASPNSNSNRTLNLPDSSGTVVVTGGAQTIEFAAGTASAPSITTTGDTNTGIFFPAADTIAFAEGGAEAARFDSSGNFGLGVTPSAWGSGWRGFNIGSGSGISNTSSTIYLSSNGYNDGTNWKYINSVSSGMYYISGNIHAWNTADSGTAGNNITYTERARITSGGDFLIGTSTKLSGGIDGLDINTASETGITFGKSGTSKAYFYLLTNASAFQWQTDSGVAINVVSSTNGVTLANGGTSWGSLSDERKKDIIEPIENAAEKVSTLRAVIGKYKTEEDGIRRSMLIAQDVQAVLPEAVVENNDGDLILQYTDTIPLLVAAIKELKAINDAQAQRIETLKANNAALEARITAIENGA